MSSFTFENTTSGINLGFKCVNDTWDQDGSVTYASAAEFLFMCEQCFGEQPSLVERDGDFYDATTDALVLEIL